MKKLLPLLLLVLLGCPSSPPPKPPEPQPYEPGTCGEWCNNAERLGCPAAKPTKAGATCVTVCENLETSGITKWNLGCRAKASSCTAADACEKK